MLLLVIVSLIAKYTAFLSDKSSKLTDFSLKIWAAMFFGVTSYKSCVFLNTFNAAKRCWSVSGGFFQRTISNLDGEYSQIPSTRINSIQFVRLNWFCTLVRSGGVVPDEFELIVLASSEHHRSMLSDGVFSPYKHRSCLSFAGKLFYLMVLAFGRAMIVL